MKPRTALIPIIQSGIETFLVRNIAKHLGTFFVACLSSRHCLFVFFLVLGVCVGVGFFFGLCLFCCGGFFLGGGVVFVVVFCWVGVWVLFVFLGWGFVGGGFNYH
jgi:hypothetical protein